jgi:hypothetical protein
MGFYENGTEPSGSTKAMIFWSTCVISFQGSLCTVGLLETEPMRDEVGR